MSRSPRTLFVAFAVSTLALVSLAGCTQVSAYPEAGQAEIAATTSPAAPTVSVAPTASPTASAAPSAPTVPTAPTTSVPAPPPPPPPAPSVANCSSASFRTSYIPLDGSAGKQHGELVFKNISGAPCQTNGYPRAQFVTPSGSPEGAEAVDDGQAIGPALQIAAHGSVYSLVTLSDGSLVEICEIVSVTNLAVITPGGETWVDVAIPETNACENGNVALISVGLIQPG